MSEDLIHIDRERAFSYGMDLASHILEYANAYHVISGEDHFMGQRRVRFVILLLMFEEYGKLFTLLSEVERSAKSDYENVRVENFHDHCLNGKTGAMQILNEVQEIEKAAKMLVKSKHPKDVGNEWVKQDFCDLKDNITYMLPDSQREQETMPTDDQMDIYAGSMERNSICAAEYLHELAKALGLWRESGIAVRHSKGAPKHDIRYGPESQSRIVR